MNRIHVFVLYLCEFLASILRGQYGGGYLRLGCREQNLRHKGKEKAKGRGEN
jgi:hypothetical protein